MNAALRLIIPTALAMLATGCASINPAPPVDVLPTMPPPVAAMVRPAGPATGGLFHTASYRPAFEDQRARLVGDLVTIKIKEDIIAKQNSTSKVNRESNIDGGIKALPFLSSTLAGKIAGKSTIGAKYDNDFKGEGETQSTNEFSSDITAMVTEVLPNGHLVIAGEKQVGVNRSVDVLRFSGIVDPRRLKPGSTIHSKDVANVRVVSRGLGEQAEVQAIGWLTRAFNTVTPF